MIPRAATACATLALTLVSSAAWSWANVPVGSPFPPIALPALKGGTVTLDVGDAPALCILYLRADQERSRRALADLVKLHAKYRDQRVKIVAVATAMHDGRSHAAELVKRLKPPFPLLLDEKGRLRGTGGLFVYPTTGLVDREGRLRYAYASHRPDYAITVERQLRALLGVGPAPEQIVDVDRNASSAEQRHEQRTTSMEAALRAKEEERARNRLAAARGLLAAETLGLVLGVYDKWAATLPPPAAPELAAAARQVRSGGAALDGAVTQLRKLVGAGAHAEQAQLWLGRALATQGKRDEAIALLSRCEKSRELRGQCAFELARLLSASDAARALSLCKQGLQLALEPAPR